MKLAEIVAEARRLDEATRADVPFEEWSDLQGARDAFYTEHFPALLAVAEAAVEMVAAENDFLAFYGFTGADTKRVLDRRFAAFAALQAALDARRRG